MGHRRIAVWALLAALAAFACRPTDRPGSSELPVAFLQDRVDEVVRDLDRGRDLLEEDPARAASSLASARLRARQLSEYYLPLLAARAQVERALAALAQEISTTRAAVDSAEARLMEIVGRHGRHLETEMREPLGWIEDVRTALAADDPAEARRTLRRLRDHLESIFFRGELVLEGSELDPESRPD